MASADWSTLANSIDNATIRSGVTSGITPPGGGGSFVYGFNSRTTGFDGARVLKYISDVNFNPIPSAKGGRITGAVKRMASGGQTGFAPFLYILEQANDANGEAYMLGLQDDDPSAIVLRKGVLALGLPAGLIGENGVLRKSTESFATDTWLHLRLDAIVQGTGDVLLRVFRSESGDVTSPVWAAVAGMDDFNDDQLGINSGSLPYTGGRVGFGMHANDASRRAAVDHITIERQL